MTTRIGALFFALAVRRITRKRRVVKEFLPSASASTVADDDADESISDASVVTENEQEENADADKLSMDERVAMHEKLRKLDPKAAARVHQKTRDA